ncbi:MAG: hypothetical protein ACT4OD_05210 [Candidatus Nitrosotenuis sp.]
MPEIICKECGVKMFHENEDTLKIEEAIHKKFCRKKLGETHSFMHRDSKHMSTFDIERTVDEKGKQLLK